MSENELVNLSEMGIEAPEQSKAVEELSSATTYLPQLRVYGSGSDIVKKGLFPMGHFGLYSAKGKVVDLGEQIDVLVVHYHPRASIMLSDEQPINYYDIESDNFNGIVEKAKNKVQGHQFGLEYLLYFAAIQKFGIFFMGNPTLRRESDNVKSHQGKAVTLKIKFIETKKYSWHGCEVLSCDAPFEVPPAEDIKATYETYFANPVDSEVDLAESTDNRAR